MKYFNWFFLSHVMRLGIWAGLSSSENQRRSLPQLNLVGTWIAMEGPRKSCSQVLHLIFLHTGSSLSTLCPWFKFTSSSKDRSCWHTLKSRHNTDECMGIAALFIGHVKPQCQTKLKERGSRVYLLMCFRKKRNGYHASLVGWFWNRVLRGPSWFWTVFPLSSTSKVLGF